jgi:CRP-like cAMP-binding protein
VDGADVATLGKGDFFGEISLLLGEPPVADVVAEGPVRALQLAGPELRVFLLAYPQVMYRMLQAVSRRLDRANRRS